MGKFSTQVLPRPMYQNVYRKLAFPSTAACLACVLTGNYTCAEANSHLMTNLKGSRRMDSSCSEKTRRPCSYFAPKLHNGKKNLKPFECEQPEAETTSENKTHHPHFKTRQKYHFFWLTFIYNLEIWHLYKHIIYTYLQAGNNNIYSMLSNCNS